MKNIMSKQGLKMKNIMSKQGQKMKNIMRAILRYSFCRGRDILDIHPSITLSILLVEHSCCTYMEAVTYVFQCVINIFFSNNFNWLIYP